MTVVYFSWAMHPDPAEIVTERFGIIAYSLRRWLDFTPNPDIIVSLIVSLEQATLVHDIRQVFMAGQCISVYMKDPTGQVFMETVTVEMITYLNKCININLPEPG